MAGLFLGLALLAQDAFLRKEFVFGADTLRYRLLLPENPEPGKQYPLVLFLHGAGERGRDNEAQLVHGSQMWLNPVNRETYPAFVLFPQCPEGEFWAYDGRPEDLAPGAMPVDPPVSKQVRLLTTLLATYLDRPDVDRSRIYVMGLSMGGMCTFDLICRYPEVFAAAVPICGSVYPPRLASVHGVAVSIYHGDNDTTVPTEASRQAYRFLKSIGADVRYKEFVGCTHGSWNPAFNEPDFMSWLFSQKKH